MSDPVVISLIGNGTVILTLILTRLMSRIENKTNSSKLNDIHEATNGMKKQLEQAAYARGQKDQKDAQG